jgi:hypothetical protein
VIYFIEAIGLDVYRDLRRNMETPFDHVTVTRPGGPGDDYQEIVDEMKLDPDGVMQVTRKILARGYVKAVNVKVDFATPDGKPKP